MAFEIPMNSDGTVVAYAWQGGYPLFYVTGFSTVLCNDCVAEDPEDVDGVHIHFEGPPMTCDECGHEEASAYGEVEDEW